MAYRRLQQLPPSALGRIGGGAAGLVFGGTTVIFLPWLRAAKYPTRFGVFVGLPMLLFALPFVLIWSLIFGVAAMRTGYRAGIWDALDILNIIWKTGESHDPKIHALAESLRKTIITSAFGSFVLFCLG